MATPYATNQFSPQCLDLTDIRPIGMGNRRHVFAHPQLPDLCIKVARSAHIRAQLDAKGGLYRFMGTHRRDDNWLEAQAYQQKALQAPPEARVWQYVPRLYGWQETSQGPGLVFDYYRDETGGPAPSLETALKAEGLSPRLETALESLRGYIGETDLTMRHPGPPNIVLATDGDLKLIDCLGTYNTDFSRYIPALRRKRLARHTHYLNVAVGRILTARKTAEPS